MPGNPAIEWNPRITLDCSSQVVGNLTWSEASRATARVTFLTAMQHELLLTPTMSPMLIYKQECRFQSNKNSKN